MKTRVHQQNSEDLQGNCLGLPLKKVLILDHLLVAMKYHKDTSISHRVYRFAKS